MATLNNRAYGVGKYALELQKTRAGWVKEVDGGHASAEVVVEKIGSDHLHHKHLGTLKFDEITFKCGAGMSQNLYNWIDASFNQRANTECRQDGAIIHADYDNNEVGRLNFTHSIPTEFGMPALDASSKDPCMMTVKMQPETTQRIGGGKGKIASSVDVSKQKQWLPSNFRLKIPGLGTDFVNKVEALTIKQKVTEHAVGARRIYERIPTSVEIPNLVITFSEQQAEDWYQWHKTFVIDGHCGQKDEKDHAILEYLAPDTVTVLFTLTFKQLGIFKLSPDKVEAGGEGIRRLKAEMYCEDIRFNFSPGSTYGNT